MSFNITHDIFIKQNPYKLFFKIAVPGSIGMLASALYGLIDGLFVSNFLGQTAFSAVNIAYPFVFLTYAVPDLIGIGSSVIIAIKQGEGKKQEADRIFTGAIIAIFTVCLILGLLFTFTSPYLIKMVGASGVLAEYAKNYLAIYSMFLPISGFVFALDNFLRISHFVKTSMFINILMSLIIILLEYLFIGVLHLGVFSAALAACCGFIFAVICSFIPFVFKKTNLHFTKPEFHIKEALLVIKNGTPTFLNNISGKVISIIFNTLLLSLGGEEAVATYGILMYVDWLIIPLLYGMCDSMQPCIGYNYGANEKNRIKIFRNIIFFAALFLCLIAFILCLLIPTEIVKVFTNSQSSEEFILMAKNALIIFSFNYLFRWFVYASQSFFQATGKPLLSASVSISYTFIFPLILIGVLYSFGLIGLWLNIPISALLTAILAFILLIVDYKRNSKKVQNIKY